ncbi:hypothetical protein [Mesorhizobium australicum]|uniref:hypothetical protein n=1 Tax=Mesorhizobium australicum TaxID=536018 RepID=UPI003334F0B8
MPLPDSSIEAISVHTIYFWSSLEDGMLQFARVMRPEGRLVIGFLPKEHMDAMGMPQAIFTPRDPEQVLLAMRAAGLRDGQIRQPDGRRWLAATAVKPGWSQLLFGTGFPVYCC